MKHPRAFDYLRCELTQLAAGQGAAALMLMCAASSALGFSRIASWGQGVTLAVTVALMSLALCVSAVRKASLARAFATGDLPRLPAGFEVFIRERTTPFPQVLFTLLFGYGFVGIWLNGAWLTARQFPESRYAVFARVGTALMLASLYYMARSLIAEAAAVRLATQDRDGLTEDVRATIALAAEQGIVPERVSVGGMLGLLMLLITYLTLTLDPMCARIAVQLLGERPCGIVWEAALAGLVLVLGFPVVPLMHVCLTVMQHGLRTRGRASIKPLGFAWYLFSRYDGPDASYARKVVAWCALYFGLLFAWWILYAHQHGL